MRFGEARASTMIFKSCAWPSEVKEAGGTPSAGRTEHKIAHAVLRCCPCVFRCRKSVGVSRDEDGDDDGASVSTIVTTATATPVIALRLNQSRDTAYVALAWVDTFPDDLRNDEEKERSRDW